jgi:hypothetical protein
LADDDAEAGGDGPLTVGVVDGQFGHDGDLDRVTSDAVGVGGEDLDGLRPLALFCLLGGTGGPSVLERVCELVCGVGCEPVDPVGVGFVVGPGEVGEGEVGCDLLGVLDLSVGLPAAGLLRGLGGLGSDRLLPRPLALAFEVAGRTAVDGRRVWVVGLVGGVGVGLLAGEQSDRDGDQQDDDGGEEPSDAPRVGEH